jgi:hypothetical protein
MDTEFLRQALAMARAPRSPMMFSVRLLEVREEEEGGNFSEVMLKFFARPSASFFAPSSRIKFLVRLWERSL